LPGRGHAPIGRDDDAAVVERRQCGRETRLEVANRVRRDQSIRVDLKQRAGAAACRSDEPGAEALDRVQGGNSDRLALSDGRSAGGTSTGRRSRGWRAPGEEEQGK